MADCSSYNITMYTRTSKKENKTKIKIKLTKEKQNKLFY